MRKTLPTYHSCAYSIAKSIAEFWQDYQKFWRVGNGFTTLVDYFALVEPKPKGISIANIVNHTLDVYDAHRSDTNLWYDDFSWMGVAFLQAKHFNSVLNIDPDACWQRAQACWSWMSTHATKVWDNAKNNPTWKNAEPRFPGGCWNFDFSEDSLHPCDPLKGSGSGPFNVCGIQNTVTNAQFLVLSIRCFLEKKTEEYQTLARTAWKWFQNWSDTNVSDDDKLLAPPPMGEGLLIRERVSTYAFRDGKYPSVLDYQKDFYWTGDQGIFLGAAVDMAQMDPDHASSYRKTAQALLQGVKIWMVDNQGQGKFLPPWAPDTKNVGGFSEDYSTGTGVFLRYLLSAFEYAFRNDPGLAQDIKTVYGPFLQGNADAICQSIGKCQRWPENQQPDDQECLLNQLATLNAAINILKLD